MLIFVRMFFTIMCSVRVLSVICLFSQTSQLLIQAISVWTWSSRFYPK